MIFHDMTTVSIRVKTIQYFNVKYVERKEGLTWLELMQVYSAFPKCWNQGILEPELPQEVLLYDEIVDAKKPAAYCYNCILKNHAAHHIQQYHMRYCKHVQVVDMEDFLTLFKRLYKITKNARLRSFQYRLLIGKVYTRDTLYKWKIVDSPTCTQCPDNDLHNTKHLLWDCINAKKVWKAISALLPLDTPLQYTDVINNDLIPLNCIENWCILVAKYHIFRCFCKNIDTSGKTIVNELETLYNLEIYNAKRLGRSEQEEKRWKNIKWTERW